MRKGFEEFQSIENKNANEEKGDVYLALTNT